MSKLGKFAAACAAVLCAFGAEATTWYVGVEGSDDNAGTSSGKAFRTVEKAVSVSGEGDEIVILPSAAVYPISAEIVLSAGITIRGQSGNPEDVVLQRTASGRGLLRVVRRRLHADREVESQKGRSEPIIGYAAGN